jgi:plasmid stability protein
MMYDIIWHMKRTTIFLPESLERQLQQFARHHDRPVAEVVREALTAHLDANRRPFRMPETFDSGHTDTAERMDELLFKNFDIHNGLLPSTDDTDSK